MENIVEIKGSKGKFYEVDLSDLSCNCKDWTCRRHNFVKGDRRRLCKHLIEALELTQSLPSDNIEFQSKKEFDIEFIKRLSSKLRESDLIVRHQICGEYARGSKYQTTYVPIVISLTNPNISRSLLDKLMEDIGLYSINGYDGGMKRYYKGKMPCVLILANQDFLFRTLINNLERRKFIRLSSICKDKLGMKLTEVGFMKDNEIVYLDISTEDELCEILGIDNLAD